MQNEKRNEKLRVIHLKPGEKASVVEIEDSLKAMQELVGGMIEEYMPWEDEVAIICNDEGKMNGLPFNRGIRDEEGHLMDIIAGDFFICYAPIESGKFLSMPEELEKKYTEMFEFPEMFMRNGREIESIQYDPTAIKEQEIDAR